MTRILACTTCAEDWKAFLAKPEKHWKDNYSAKSLATRWEAADGLPTEVAAALDRSPEGVLSNARPFLAIPEYKVALPGGERASQTDLMVIGRAKGGPFAMAVEGKVNEPFGPTIEEWKAKASDGRKERWRYLRQQLGLTEKPSPELRYQLFHRAVSALIAARRYHSPFAVLLVHSFSRDDTGYGDFAKFLTALGGEATKGAVNAIRNCDGVMLYAGWVQGIREHAGKS